MTLLIHPGFHKTGTTWLQEQLFRDTTLFNMMMSHGEIDSLIVRPHDFEFDPVLACAQVAERMSAGQAVNVLSSEILVGNPFYGSRDAVGLAQRLQAIAPDSRILLTIREQGAMIRSLYQQYVKRGGSLPIQGFLNQPCEPGYFGFAPDILQYERHASLYAKLFGPENVMVLPQELLAKDPSQFVDRVLKFAGHSGLPDGHMLPSGRSGKSFPPGGTPLIRLANHLRPSVLHPGGLRSTRWIGESLLRAGYFFNIGNARQRRQWSNAVNPMRVRYGASNRLLQPYCPVKLADFGYVMEEEAKRM